MDDVGDDDDDEDVDVSAQSSFGSIAIPGSVFGASSPYISFGSIVSWFSMARRPPHAWEDDEDRAACVREGAASSGMRREGSAGSSHVWEDHDFPERLAARLEEEGVAVDLAAVGAGSADPGASDSEGEDEEPISWISYWNCLCCEF